MKNYFRLQAAGISIEEMRSFTSDYSNDAEYLDDTMFVIPEMYLAALEEQRETFGGTICVSDNPYDKSFGGAAGMPDAEVVVLAGQKAFDIYDGCRLYSETLIEIARFPYETWREMQESGKVEEYI